MKFKNFTIKNVSRKRYGGFSHDSTLYVGDTECSKASVHYYNRTWESYQFKTSMTRVVEEMIYFNEGQIHKQEFPEWKRLNSVRRKKLHQKFKVSNFGSYTGQDLVDLLERIASGKDEPASPVLSMAKAFMFLGDMVNDYSDKKEIADAVKYKERIVFATMRNQIPDWQKPEGWDRLNDADKLERLTKIQNTL